MKKGLLLSVVASTMIFAGGDIAPVEPAAAAPAADCSDFYGSVGAYYQSQQADSGDLFSTDAGVGATNFSVSATLGVEKEIANGIGFGAEVSGWSTLGWSDGPANDNITARVPAGTLEGGRLSQLYLTASFGNTAAKVGRFALPISLSPFAWTDSWAGVKDVTFEGALVANTDLADTTVYGVYVKNAFVGESTRAAIGADEGGLFALGMVNKSLANTTITAVGYYAPDYTVIGEDLVAVFGTANTTFGDYKLDIQAAYVADAGQDASDDTFAIGARISGTFGMFDASLAASYINESTTALYAAGGYWLYTSGEEDDRLNPGLATTAIQAKVSAKVGIGKLYGRLAYYMDDGGAGAQTEDSVGARVGYKFTVSGIDMKAEYRYRNRTAYDGTETERHRVRLEAAYKF